MTHPLPRLFALMGLVSVTSPGNAQLIAQVSTQPVQERKSPRIELKHALRELKEYYKVDLLYFDRIVQGYTVSRQAIHWEAGLEQNLEQLLHPLGLTFKKTRNKGYVITQTLPVKESKAGGNAFDGSGIPEAMTDVTGLESIQAITVRGRVTDSLRREGVPGVSVVIKGTSRGVTTASDGRYSLSVDGPDAVLVFTSVGYQKKEIAVGGRSVIDVVLVEDQKALSEVVVTGFGDRSKRNVGYATTMVDGDAIRRQGAINPISALQGMVPGLQVQPGIGGPQATPRFLIRGSASLDPYRNQPLIVIDGIVMEQDVVLPNRGGDQDFGNVLKDINPDDIESVNVLKGGAVTALYGSRANNGVILIKTKRGFSQKGLGVTVSQSLIWDKPYRTVDFQNRFGSGNYTGDFITGPNGELQINPNTYGYNFGPEMTGQEVRDVTGKLMKNNPRPDDILSIFQTGLTSNTNVGISGGNENGTFRLSYSRLGSQGVTPRNNFDRNSFNFRGTQRLLGKVLVDANVTYVRSNTSNPANQGGSGIFRNMAYGGVRNYDMDFWRNNYIAAAGGINQDDPSGFTSVWYALYQNNNTQIDNNLRGSVDLRAPLGAGFEFQGTASVNYVGSNNEKKTRGTEINFANPGYESFVRNTTVSRFRGSMNYNKTFGEFDALLQVGGELNASTSKGVRYWTNGGILPDIYRLKNSRNPVGTEEDKPNQTRSNSVFYQASLAFRDYLTMNIYGRNDWNSTLVYNDGHGNYSYFYPGVDVAWVFTDAFKHALPSAFTFGKLRASYVISGNGTSAYNANTGAYGANSPYINVNGTTVINYAYQSNTLPNQALVPERTKKFETGIELKMFNNRFGIDATYYTQDTKNQIINFGVPSSSGVGSALINAGVVRNRGIELLIYGTPIKTRNFSWDTYFNYTRNRNTVVSLPFGLQYIGIGGGDGFQAIAKAGGAYGTIIAPYGYAHYQARAGDGTPIDSPLNGKRVIRPSSANTSLWVRAGNYVNGVDKAPVLGSIIPDFLGNWRNSFNYKSFQLNVILDAKFGGKIYSTTSDLGQWLGNLKSTLPGRTTELGGIAYKTAAGADRTDGIIFDGVYQQGSTVTGIDGKSYDVSGMTHREAYEKGIVRPTSAFSYYANGHSWANGIREDAIFTSSWVSLQQVNLSYDLPQKMVSRLKLNGLRVAVMANNLLYLYNSAKDNVNPNNLNDSGSGAMVESSGMPYIRSMGFSINGSF
jgi:iron complex outermembrane receptor protein